MRPKTTFLSSLELKVFEKTADPKPKASGPEILTTAIPPAPGAVEMATIVEPSRACGRDFFKSFV